MKFAYKVINNKKNIAPRFCKRHRISVLFLLPFYCYQISVITFRSFDNRIRLPHPIAEGSGHICLPEAKMYNNKKSTRVGSEAQYGPRLAGEILHDYLNNSNEPMAVAFREQAQDDAHQGWHTNT